MNEELQKQIIEIVKGSKDFVVSQAPDTIQQFLAIQAVECIGWFILSLVLLPVVLYIGKKMHDRTDGVVWVVIAPMAFLFLFGIISNPINYYEITHYPKGFLMQQALGHK